MRTLVLSLIAAGLCAADPVGLWRFGVGSLDGQPARVGTIVHTGQQLVAAESAPRSKSSQVKSQLPRFSSCQAREKASE